MTKVDLDKELIGLDGKAILMDGKPFHVGPALAHCLTSGRAETVQDGVAAYLLSERLRRGGSIELAPDEVVRLHKAVLASQFTLLLTGQLLFLLEAKP
jgi:hypothetical protein